MKKNIVLIGFMGSGKTTFGKKLSRRMGYQFIDTDKWIESRQGKRISRIFEEEGEAFFRKLEAETVKEISQSQGLIIGTGGGIVKNDNSMELLKEGGVIVYLKATPEHIFKNVANDKTRPLLQTSDKMETIQNLMKERTPVYKRWADVTVDVTGGTVNQVCGRIIKALEGRI